MKLWLYLLVGFALFLGLFWILAATLGFLQYLIWIIVLGAVVFGAASLLLSRYELPARSGKESLRDRGKAERELKHMEKRHAREKAR